MDCANATRFFSELADLEWHAQLAWMVPSEPALSPIALAAIPEDRWAEVQLGLDPTAHLMRSAYQVGNLWRNRKQKEVPLALPAEKLDTLIIFRAPDGAFWVYSIEPAQFAFLEAFAEGTASGRRALRKRPVTESRGP